MSTKSNTNPTLVQSCRGHTKIINITKKSMIIKNENVFIYILLFKGLHMVESTHCHFILKLNQSEIRVKIYKYK